MCIEINRYLEVSLLFAREREGETKTSDFWFDLFLLRKQNTTYRFLSITSLGTIFVAKNILFTKFFSFLMSLIFCKKNFLIERVQKDRFVSENWQSAAFRGGSSHVPSFVEQNQDVRTIFCTFESPCAFLAERRAGGLRSFLNKTTFKSIAFLQTHAVSHLLVEWRSICSDSKRPANNQNCWEKKLLNVALF